MSQAVVENNTYNIDTGIQGADEKDTVMITKEALEQIRKVREANNVPEEFSLRMGVKSGGCSGMQYIIGFDSEVNDSDEEIKVEDMNIIIDRKSLFYLQGVTLDYVDDVHGKGFVFNNPNNENVCGCGSGGSC